MHHFVPGTDSFGPIVLLNTPILTDCGLYRMREVSVEEARAMVQAHGFVSAVGHQAAAGVLSQLLDIDCQFERVRYQQRPCERAIALRMNARLDEGTILSTAAQMLEIGYTLALLIRYD